MIQPWAFKKIKIEKKNNKNLDQMQGSLCQRMPKEKKNGKENLLKLETQVQKLYEMKMTTCPLPKQSPLVLLPQEGEL